MKRNLQKLRRRAALAMLSFCLFLACAWIVFDRLFTPFAEELPTGTVPDYVGAVYETADFPEWLSPSVEYRYDADTPAGTVLGQLPAAGTVRKIGGERPACELRLTVSMGARCAVVPEDLAGEDVRIAAARLRDAGFAVETVVSTGAYPEGIVLSVSPRGGETVPYGSKVTLSVSAGAPAVTVTVPDLFGLTRADALVRAWISQLAVATVTEEESPYPAGTVIGQNYLPGTVVTAGTKLTIRVSKGDL